jgi:uncharacterized DUF497 family protein
MRYDACDWDDARGANVDHVAEHGVTPEEWQEVLDAADPADVEPSESDQDHWTYLGETARGRTLRIVFVMEGDEDFLYIRPITGYEPT